MEWSRTGNPFEYASWLFLCSLWWFGGWWLVKYVFKIRPREQLLTGFGLGMSLFIAFSNILAHWLPLVQSFWISAVVLCLAGLAVGIGQRNRLQLSSKDASVNIGLGLAFFILLFVFTRINLGLAIFDDNNNLPLVSRLATGDFPPHFYLNPAQRLDYHYGLHLFAASLVQVGGLLPWSALDISKAVSLSLLLLLVWLWFRRQVQPNKLVFFGTLFIALASGTRWLLLLIPENRLIKLSSQIQLIGSALTNGPELYQALVKPWIIEGGSPIPFPFAFSNGVSPPIILAMTGYGALPYLTAVLLALLLSRKNTTIQKALLGLVFSSLALTGEHLLVMLWIGIFLAVVISWLAGHPSRQKLAAALHWGWFLFPSLVIAVFSGGVVTEFLKRTFTSAGAAAQQPGIGFGGFSLRFPPGITSAHLGELSFFNPSQLLVAVLEIGPLIFLVIPVIHFCLKRFKTGDIRFTGFSLAAAIGLLLPPFIQLSLRDRDISRMTGMSLFLLILLGYPLTALIWRESGKMLKSILLGGYVISLLGGIALLPLLLVAMARPQPSYFISQLDQQMTKKHWSSLEKDAAVFDPAFIYRPATIFGSSAGQAYQDIYKPFPTFTSLLLDPDPHQAASQGYLYYYVDNETWFKLPATIQVAFTDHCVKIIDHIASQDGDFRTLYDVRQCQE